MAGATKAEPRWALVTGASSGLGSEFARQLAGKGYDVVLVARRRDRLEKLAAELLPRGRDAVVLAQDLAGAGAVTSLVQELGARGIAPELLVNNAGVGMYGLALDHSPARVEALLRVNVLALTELALALGRRMAERGSGGIINVSSTASLQPDPWLAVYGASKAYVTSFSMALAEELGPRGVRVLTLCPGLTDTEFNQTAGVHAAHDARWMYMSAAECVAIALRAAERKRRFVIAGWMNRIAAFAARHAPLTWVTRANGWLMAPKRGFTSPPARRDHSSDDT
jgi:short-subunit dehydrogenase